MNINILAIGDVSGKVGMEFLTEKLASVQKFYDIGFTVVNAENSAGLGVKPEHAQALIGAGADVVTLGNHTWGVKTIREYLDKTPNLLRPANFAQNVPGRGWGIFETNFGDICVINLIGRADMPYSYVCDSPFFEVDRILKQISTNVVLVDFHAEATSEKLAMAYHLENRVSALWGTHTHVQTSDSRVFTGGMGYITDLGMTGAIDSVIGMNPSQSLARFLGGPPDRFSGADGPGKIEGAVFEIDPITGKCAGVKAIRIV